MKALWRVRSCVKAYQQQSVQNLVLQTQCLCTSRKYPVTQTPIASPRCSLTARHTLCTQGTAEEDNSLTVAEQLENLTPEQKHKLEKLKVGLIVKQSTGTLPPMQLTEEQCLELTRCTTFSSGMKMITAWAFKQMYKDRKMLDSNERLEAHNEFLRGRRERYYTRPLQNTFHQFFRPGKMIHHQYNNLFYAMLNGPHIVYDMSFGDQMNPVELNLLAHQIHLVYSQNKGHPEPFHIHLCGLDRSSYQYNVLLRKFPSLEKVPFTISEDNYLNHYPKERLVYLTPDSTTDLLEYKEEDVYIVGGMVDRQGSQPLTWTKAQRQGIRTARLPLDKYLRWKLGTKSLTLDQVLNIMLDIRRTGRWMEAFKHIPKRKVHRPPNLNRKEDNRKFKKPTDQSKREGEPLRQKKKFQDFSSDQY